MEQCDPYAEDIMDQIFQFLLSSSSTSSCSSSSPLLSSRVFTPSSQSFVEVTRRLILKALHLLQVVPEGLWKDETNTCLIRLHSSIGALEDDKNHVRARQYTLGLCGEESPPEGIVITFTDFLQSIAGSILTTPPISPYQKPVHANANKLSVLAHQASDRTSLMAEKDPSPNNFPVLLRSYSHKYVNHQFTEIYFSQFVHPEEALNPLYYGWRVVPVAFYLHFFCQYLGFMQLPDGPTPEKVTKELQASLRPLYKSTS